MRQTVFIFVLFVLSFKGNAQFLVWADIGITQSSTTFIDNYTSKTSYNDSRYNPTCSVNAITDFKSNINIGLSLYVTKYAFAYLYSQDSSGAMPYERNSFKNNSVYVYLAPVLDFRIDKKNKWHFEFKPSAGFFITGQDYINITEINTAMGIANANTPLPKYYHHEASTADRINKAPMNVCFQLQRYFSLKNGAHVSAYLAYNFVFGRLTTITELTYILSTKGFSFGLGYLKEYRKKPKPATTSTFPRS